MGFSQRLTVRLTAGVVLVLLSIGVPFLFAFQRHLQAQRVEALDRATTTLSQVIVGSLANTMMSGDPHAIDGPIRDLANQEMVQRALLLDHRGRVAVSSDPAYDGVLLTREEAEICSVCHGQDPGRAAEQAALVLHGGDRVYRTMTIVPNEPRCHACHDPARAVNGLLVLDLVSVSGDAWIAAEMGTTIALGGVMVLLTVAVLVGLLRAMVHRPLQAAIASSRKVVEGDLAARVPPATTCEFARLGSHLNRMTDHLARSLQSLQVQSRQRQEILDAMDEEVVVLDAHLKVVAANRKFLSLPGRDQPEGRGCRDVAGREAPCAATTDDCPVRRVFATGQVQKAIVSRTVDGGRQQTVEIHASPIRGPDGAVSQAVEVRRDISDRRQMEATLAQSERLSALGLLASGLSHEINNPLAAILTTVEGLQRRLQRDPGVSPASAAGLHRTLGRIASAVQRGRTITHRLLSVARPDGDARSLVNVNEVIRELVLMLGQVTRRAQVKVELDLDGRLPPLRGDESRLGQVLMNLALNAIQAMHPEGGEIRIRTRSEGAAIHVELEDTGPGIPQESLARIYEPFYTTKPAGQGTGLGLFITHRIVSEMGGTIQAKSQVGRGSRFALRFPGSRERASA